jgi:hypothetical protein
MDPHPWGLHGAEKPEQLPRRRPWDGVRACHSSRSHRVGLPQAAPSLGTRCASSLGPWRWHCGSLGAARRGHCHRCWPGAVGAMPSLIFIPTPPIISPGWWWGTLALNPSAEPRCHPAAARHGCHPKATSGCVPRSRDRLLPAVGTRGELRARCAPRLPGRLRNLPPQLFSAECVATGENSRTVYLLAQICLPPVWLQGQACRLGPGKWGGVFASKKAGRASTAGRHPAQPCCAPQTAASPGALDPIQDTGEEALVTF